METQKHYKGKNRQWQFHVFTNLFMFFFLTHLVGSSQPDLKKTLPVDFGDKAMSHIRFLSKIGPRTAGTANEMEAARYIEKQFKDMGLKTEIEVFEYESFEISSLNLEIDNVHYTPLGLGFTPYNNIRAYSGKAVLIDSKKPDNKYEGQDLSGMTILSNDFTSHFTLLQYKPALIIYLDSTDFAHIESNKKLDYHLKIDGEYKKFKSPNVIAQTGDETSSTKEILIGAHLDSYKNSPGANDNGSGVGVMIELARLLKQSETELAGNIKFIAFGAEELGILGSRRYVAAHSESLKKCALYFNIDDVGGNGKGVIETQGGVSEIQETLKDDLSLMLAKSPWEGVLSNWKSLPEKYLLGHITSVNHPDWLVDIIENTINESGHEIGYAYNLGSDQMSFAYAGIAASSIGIQGEGTHTAHDTIEKVNQNSIKKAGGIVFNVVWKTNKMLKK